MIIKSHSPHNVGAEALVVVVVIVVVMVVVDPELELLTAAEDIDSEERVSLLITDATEELDCMSPPLATGATAFPAPLKKEAALNQVPCNPFAMPVRREVRLPRHRIRNEFAGNLPHASTNGCKIPFDFIASPLLLAF